MSTATTTTTTALPYWQHACSRCSAIWSGLKTSHCSACHATFTTPTAFDRHRSSGSCLLPMAAGLTDAGRDYPCWGLPGTGNPHNRTDNHEGQPQ